MRIEIKDQHQGKDGVEVSGDLYFRLINSKNGDLICRFAMNTAFITEDGVYRFDKKGVDPDSIIHNKKFDSSFQIELKFEDVCKTCKPTNPLANLCLNCQASLQTEISEWETIKNIVDKHYETMRGLAHTSLSTSTIGLKKRASSVRPNQKKQLKEVGASINYKNPNNNDYNDIIFDSEKVSQIVCEVLTKSNQDLVRTQNLVTEK